MTDVFSIRKRSQIMSRVRSSGNRATELAFIGLLRRHRIVGWRRRLKLVGRPDFAFPKVRVAVFVDGCFWHACPVHSSQPASNAAFWTAKLARNRRRDRAVTLALKQAGWQVLRIWQHELLRRNEARLIKRVRQAIRLV
jgi:DNA mismatch endonuclease (patch repair protein)